MKKIVPKKLEKGMKVGVIAPSNTAKIDDEEDKEAIKKSINLFKDWGFEVILGEHVYLNSNGYGADPKKRAEDINNMFANKEVGLIFCIKG
jgi:muramoyltetrapeptide carboxypeptidase